MIRSFRDKETENIFYRYASKKLPKTMYDSARRKLLILYAATELKALRIPPGNRLASLKGDRKGRYSIRINNQWRICFAWKNGDAHEEDADDDAGDTASISISISSNVVTVKGWQDDATASTDTEVDVNCLVIGTP